LMDKEAQKDNTISMRWRTTMRLQSAEEAGIVQLMMRHQDLSRGMTQLMKLRCKATRFAPWLAQMEFILPEFREKCPMCLQRVPEDEPHVLLSCTSFAAERERFLATWIRRASLRAVNNSGIVSLLLRGERDGRQLDGWSSSLVDLGRHQVRELTEEDRHWGTLSSGGPDMEAMNLGETESTRIGCLDVARFMEKVSRLRAQRLATVSPVPMPPRVEARQGMTALVRTAANQVRHNSAVALQNVEGLVGERPTLPEQSGAYSAQEGPLPRVQESEQSGKLGVESVSERGV
jgi:hypothetical protein